MPPMNTNLLTDYAKKKLADQNASKTLFSQPNLITGQRAASPATNVQQPTNTLQSKFAAKPFTPPPGTQGMNVGLLTPTAQARLQASSFPAGNPAVPQAPKAPVAPATPASQTSQVSQPSQTTGPTGPTGPTVSPQASQPATPTFPGMLTTLFQRTQEDSPEVRAARQALLQSQMNEAQQLGLNYQNPIPLEFQQGRAQVLQSQYGQQQQALGAALTSATQTQGQQLGALQGAIGAAQPQLGAYGQAYYQPLQAGGAGGGVQPNDPFYQTLQQYAGMMASGQMAGIPSSITSNPVLNAQVLQMAKQINPSFNYNIAGALGGVQQQQTQQQQQWQSARQQAGNLGMQLTDLVNKAGVNPNDVNAVNTAIQAIANNVSNPYYQTFHNLVNDLTNTYAQILTPEGGSPTDMVRSISNSLLNASASGRSILQVMGDLDAQAQAKIAGVPTVTQQNAPANQPKPWIQ